MAAIKYRDEHNKVGFLEKPKGSDDYHQILDFLRGSHIRYALTHDPIIYDSLVKQFWTTASLKASKEGPPAILATIDRTPYTITESLVRSQLQLDDEGGVEDLPIADIYLGMDNLGYPSEGKLTFFKNKFSPQWRFLVHTIMHCLSTKSGSWDQFGSQLAIAIICLTEGRIASGQAIFSKGWLTTSTILKSFCCFLGDHMPLLATMLPPSQAAITGESSGEDAPSHPQTVPATITEPDHSHDHMNNMKVLFKPHLLGATSAPPEGTPQEESDLNAQKLLFKEVVGKLVKKIPDQDVDPLISWLSSSYSCCCCSRYYCPLLLILQQEAELKFGKRERRDAEEHNMMYVIHKILNRFWDWTDIMGQVQANQGLTPDLLGPDVTEDNIAERMVALIAKRRREFAIQRFKDKLNKPMTYAQQKAFMRTFMKNQSSTIYTTGWTMKHVKSFSNDQLKTEFDKIRTAAADFQLQNIRRSLKKPGVDLEQTSTKKSKLTEAPRSDVLADSQQPSVEVHSQKDPIEDVEVPSNTASITQHTGSSFKKVGTRKKRLGRKGVHPSHSTIPIEDGDPEAEHKMCLKYASDADFASDDDTPVNLFAVLTWIDKQAEGVGLVLWGDLKVLIDSPEVNDGSDVWKNQNTWSIQSWKLYSYSGVHVLETVDGLVLHMFVDKKYPLSVNLIERMLDHQLEICHDTVGNELTTAVQLIAFLKKQISDSRRPKVHDWYC
ncbi:hypothetical protein Tco_0910693 [Tanacetum coccineum]|uniref:Synaptobrevin, longin-like domain protein n=1 Tax=Tanacetum coccineum TaxID=301880 RepID=A0ABQ5CWU6_9ASTR